MARPGHREAWVRCRRIGEGSRQGIEKVLQCARPGRPVNRPERTGTNPEEVGNEGVDPETEQVVGHPVEHEAEGRKGRVT